MLEDVYILYIHETWIFNQEKQFQTLYITPFLSLWGSGFFLLSIFISTYFIYEDNIFNVNNQVKWVLENNYQWFLQRFVYTHWCNLLIWQNKCNKMKQTNELSNFISFCCQNSKCARWSINTANWLELPQFAATAISHLCNLSSVKYICVCVCVCGERESPYFLFIFHSNAVHIHFWYVPFVPCNCNI